MTLGEERVAVNFNPSEIPEITQIKGVTASLIDSLEFLKQSGSPDVSAEVNRCAAIAQTKYEEACMFAVKAFVKFSGGKKAFANVDMDVAAGLVSGSLTETPAPPVN